MKRVLCIADPISWTVSGKQTGHYRAVAQNYADALSSLATVIVAGGPVYRSLEGNVLILPRNQSDRFGHLHNKIIALLNCRALFQRIKADAIVFQSVGFTTLLVGVLLFASRRNRIYLIQYRPLQCHGLFYRMLWWLVRHKVNGVLSPYDDFGRTYSVPFISVPDYFYIGTKGTSIHTEKVYDFVSVGMQHPDKGTLEFAEKVAITPYSMLIAGSVTDLELKQKLVDLAERHANIHLDLRYLTEEDYAVAIKSGRYAVMNYTDAYATHSSGVLFDFIYRRIPVVGRECNALSMISKFGMGCLYCDLTDLDIGRLLGDEVYGQYMHGIDAYLNKSSSYVESLVHFVLEDK